MRWAQLLQAVGFTGAYFSRLCVHAGISGQAAYSDTLFGDAIVLVVTAQKLVEEGNVRVMLAEERAV